MQPISIRDMTLSDIPAVVAIEAVSFTTPWSEISLRSEIGSFGSIARVAVFDGCVVGYMIAKKVLDEAQLLDLAVMKAHRRQGIAMLLMEDLIQALRERGAARLYLEVRASNAAAIRLYERFGFTIIGVRKDYYRNPVEDAQVMELVIWPCPSC
jgi:[ribosomal protein S18]-alanine N-acetyltransferase